MHSQIRITGTMNLLESFTISLKKLKRGVAINSITALLIFTTISFNSILYAQIVLFNFDNAPVYTSLPIDQTESGITAHLNDTGYGFSIQQANVLGFTPPGFSGHIIYPNSINQADLLIGFDHTLTFFLILYTTQELGCDDAATMRVTAYLNGVYAGTSTKTTANPGTWPVDSLKLNLIQGFDSVVVHYDSPPPTCQDYGVIFMADNMKVMAINPSAISNPKNTLQNLVINNPVSQNATISFSLTQTEEIDLSIYDVTGRISQKLFNGTLSSGKHEITWSVVDANIQTGIYFLRINSQNFSQSLKIEVVK